MSFSRGLFIPIGIALTVVRLGLLLGLIFLRLVLTFLQGNQSQLTCQITRFYLISCGLFVIQTGDKSKEESLCPINRSSGIDELLLSLTMPIKSVISREKWKLSSILLRITNMSFGGLPATTSRFVFEGSNDFRNLPQQQSVQPLSLEVNSFSPFHLKHNDHALLSLLKVISAPITVYHVRFLRPINLSEVNLEEDNSIPKYLLNLISKSFTDPETSHIYRLPQPTSPSRPATVPPRAVYLSPALLEQVDTVMEVFPQLSRDHVIADLRRTNDMNVTIQNAMSGKIPTAPKSAKSSKSASKGQPPVDPKVQIEVENSIDDGSNPIKAWMNLDERKSALLHFARTKYLAKHSS